jgi:hypothetical protein
MSWHQAAAFRPSATGSSDCIICAREYPEEAGKEDSKEPRLEVLQVIEGLAYHPEVPTVEIVFIFVVQNSRPGPSRLRVVHRGGVDSSLQPFTLESNLPQDRILRGLYADRIKRNDDVPGTIRFYKRINCLGRDLEPVVVSLAGPGSCFSRSKDAISLTPEVSDAAENPAYTSYLIPPADYDPMPAEERCIFTLCTTLHKETYERLVTDRFSVDSYTRLKRDIETQDLPHADQRAKDFYDRYIRPEHAIIAPQAYDIVIFQKLGGPVEVKSESIRITAGRPANGELSDEVLWFFGQPEDEEFLLILSYAKGESTNNSISSVPAFQSA